MPGLDGPLERLGTAFKRDRPLVLVGTAGVLLVDLATRVIGTNGHLLGLSAFNRLLAGYCVAHLGVALLRHGPESFLDDHTADAAVHLPHAALTAALVLLPAHGAWTAWAEPTCQAACVWRELAALDLLVGSELLRRWSPRAAVSWPPVPSWLPSWR